MQKLRANGEGRLGSGQLPTMETTLEKVTHSDSSKGQLVGSQLKMVQYPPG
jgi:hypothetical protein